MAGLARVRELLRAVPVRDRVATTVVLGLVACAVAAVPLHRLVFVEEDVGERWREACRQTGFNARSLFGPPLFEPPPRPAGTATHPRGAQWTIEGEVWLTNAAVQPDRWGRPWHVVGSRRAGVPVARYVSTGDAVDRWGRPWHLVVGLKAPGAPPLVTAVFSSGPDGVWALGEGDDLVVDVDAAMFQTPTWPSGLEEARALRRRLLLLALALGTLWASARAWRAPRAASPGADVALGLVASVAPVLGWGLVADGFAAEEHVPTTRLLVPARLAIVSSGAAAIVLGCVLLRLRRPVPAQ